MAEIYVDFYQITQSVIDGIRQKLDTEDESIKQCTYSISLLRCMCNKPNAD